MKVIVHEKFGPPDVLQLVERETPVPASNEILIRNYATTVELEDPMFRKRPGFNGIFKPKHPIPGMFFAGEVSAAGSAVTQFSTGDRVWGATGMKFGCCAEYITLAESGPLSLMPSNLSYQDAAALLNGTLTALPFLVEKGKIKEGQKVLINGASGGVGSSAVQIAKHLGTTVSGTCSTKNVELVTSLGADNVIDYTKEDFLQSGGTYDIIFDVAAKETFPACKSALTESGVYLRTAPNIGVFLGGVFGSSGKKARFTAAGLRSTDKKRADLVTITQMIEAHGMKSAIDAVYPLAQTAKAHRHVEEGRKNGVVVISLEDL
ncbi:MAG: NAD(P)-dependent alcohol dehydrogenase [Ectothiorhodospiraceae bacterium]|nr:NAD(P)-dependent alcohol dehydrogenase [Ectothiorhodospiraceae bacterium]